MRFPYGEMRISDFPDRLLATLMASVGPDLPASGPGDHRSMPQPWVIRRMSPLVAVVTACVALAVGVTAANETTPAAAWIAARQLYGLTAFGFLLGACIIGPLAAVFPRLPLKAVLLSARRAVGVGAFVFAVLHAACYLGPTLSQDWRRMFAPGTLWVAGLAGGALALLDLSLLAWTSRDQVVKAMGGERWKKLHRTVYVVTPVVFLHALLVGADFGVTADPQAERDAGSLIVFSILAALWLILARLRSRGIRWPSK